MKTIIIPTDFSLETVQVAETLVRDSNEELRFVFAHLFHVADDIQDLLFAGHREREYKMIPEEFWDECKTLKNIFPNVVKSIKVDFFYGNKLAALRNFLEHHEIDAIAYSERYGMPKLNKSSLDAMNVLKKCGLPLINTDLISVDVLAAQDAR